MTVWESIVAAIFCMVMVFIVLTCLYLFIKLFSWGIRNFENKGRKNPEQPTQP